MATAPKNDDEIDDFLYGNQQPIETTSSRSVVVAYLIIVIYSILFLKEKRSLR